MTPWHGTLAAGLMCIVLFCAIGCATAPTPLDSNERFARISAQPAEQPLLASDVFQPSELELVYEYAGGSSSGSLLHFTTSPSDEHGATWATREGDARTEYWTVDDDDNVLLLAVLDEADHAISIFDPPLSIPSQLTPGKPFREKSAMRVVDSRNTANQKASGTATRSIEYIDNQLIRTPAGEHIAQRVVFHFKADMGIATAETQTTIYVVPGSGIMAEQSREIVRVMGVFGRNQQRTLVRIKP